MSTTAPGFRVSAFRVGWYGGAQAALVWRSGRVAGHRQDRPHLVVPTRTVQASGWQRSLKVSTDGWPEGAYLLRLDAENGHQRYVPLVVRSTAAAGRTLIMHAPATWQAYNQWGGYSLYAGRDGSYAHRSLAVSFDRPYDGSGAEKFLVYERALVVLAERLGIPLAYTTGIDVHLAPNVLRGAHAAVALGHDEYWTPEQRRHVTAARDAGTNLAFLGANTCFRRVRLEGAGGSGGGAAGQAGTPGVGGTAGFSGAGAGRAGTQGDQVRTVVCYKTDFHADPYLAKHPTMATTDFRARPAADPESSMTGVLYEGFPTDAAFVVEQADHWLFAGTGVRKGQSFAHLVGVEYDRVQPGSPPPGPTEILAHSPLVCQGRHSHSDAAYYTVPSGAGVFASGTMRWVEGLMAGTREDGRDHGMSAATARFVTRTTENLLRAFAGGPAAHSHPAPRDNVATLYP
ncbi:hypothetical protein K7862_15080 [Streptomyces sp. PLK6-54]|uniref:N,N-dimethylformamidase beta subunit-like C-terminal domain-containing protein n=1 Tax=Actinacidiphila acidipaludis TaxID=2873382 RepID=A0ABS7Q738_9ACTN|nr:hypothetical protein [Streptomyces acidipaludis]